MLVDQSSVENPHRSLHSAENRAVTPWITARVLGSISIQSKAIAVFPVSFSRNLAKAPPILIRRSPPLPGFRETPPVPFFPPAPHPLKKNPPPPDRIVTVQVGSDG